MIVRNFDAEGSASRLDLRLGVWISGASGPPHLRTCVSGAPGPPDGPHLRRLPHHTSGRVWVEPPDPQTAHTWDGCPTTPQDVCEWSPRTPRRPTPETAAPPHLRTCVSGAPGPPDGPHLRRRPHHTSGRVWVEPPDLQTAHTWDGCPTTPQDVCEWSPRTSRRPTPETAAPPHLRTCVSGAPGPPDGPHLRRRPHHTSGRVWVEPPDPQTADTWDGCPTTPQDVCEWSPRTSRRPTPETAAPPHLRTCVSGAPGPPDGPHLRRRPHHTSGRVWVEPPDLQTAHTWDGCPTTPQDVCEWSPRTSRRPTPETAASPHLRTCVSGAPGPPDGPHLRRLPHHTSGRVWVEPPDLQTAHTWDGCPTTPQDVCEWSPRTPRRPHLRRLPHHTSGRVSGAPGPPDGPHLRRRPHHTSGRVWVEPPDLQTAHTWDGCPTTPQDVCEWSPRTPRRPTPETAAPPHLRTCVSGAPGPPDAHTWDGCPTTPQDVCEWSPRTPRRPHLRRLPHHTSGRVWVEPPDPQTPTPETAAPPHLRTCVSGAPGPPDGPHLRRLPHHTSGRVWVEPPDPQTAHTWDGCPTTPQDVCEWSPRTSRRPTPETAAPPHLRTCVSGAPGPPDGPHLRRLPHHTSGRVWVEPPDLQTAHTWDGCPSRPLSGLGSKVCFHLVPCSVLERWPIAPYLTQTHGPGP